MSPVHIFASGSNIHQKTVPGDDRVSIHLPIDILPRLREVFPCSDDEAESWEVVWIGWAETLIRTHDPTTVIHYGFNTNHPSNPSPRVVQLSSTHSIRQWIGHDTILGYLRDDGHLSTLDDPSDEATSSSGSPTYDSIAVTATNEIYALSDLTIYRFPDLQTAKLGATHASEQIHVPLPEIPSLPSGVITLHPGLSHLLVHARSPYSSVLGLGDNRHSSAGPNVQDGEGGSKRLEHTITSPKSIDMFEGVDVKCVVAGGGRSGVLSEAGEAWIWGKGIEGVEKVIIGGDVEEDGLDVKLLAIGEGYEVAVSEDDEIWVRGRTDLGQCGFSSEDMAMIDTWKQLSLSSKPQTYEITSVVCHRWSTFIKCRSP